MTAQAKVNLHNTILLYVIGVLLGFVAWTGDRVVNQYDEKIRSIEQKQCDTDKKINDQEAEIISLKNWKEYWDEAQKTRNTRSGGKASTVPMNEYGILPVEYKESTAIRK